MAPAVVRQLRRGGDLGSPGRNRQPRSWTGPRSASGRRG